MSQRFGPDKKGRFVKSSSTTLSLNLHFSGETRITVGGKQLSTNSALSINTATTGAGGLDTGSLAADTLYYAYAVNNSGTLAAVASTTSPTGGGPTGFTASKLVGAFYSSSTPDVLGTVTIEGTPTTGWLPFDMNVIGVGGDPTLNSSATQNKARWKRVGSSMKIKWDYQHTSVGDAVNGSGDYRFGMPASQQIDFNDIGNGDNNVVLGACGPFTHLHTGQGPRVGTINAFDSTSLNAQTGDFNNPTGQIGSTRLNFGQATVNASFRAVVPIVGWNEDKLEGIE